MQNLDEGTHLLPSAKIILRRVGALFGFTLFLNLFLFQQLGSLAAALFLLGSFVFLLLLRLENVRLFVKKAVVVFVCGLLLLGTAIVLRTFPLAQVLAFLGGFSLLLFFFFYSLATKKVWHSIVAMIATPLLALGAYTLGLLFVVSRSLNGKIGELIPVKRETVSLLRIKSLVIGGIVGIIVVSVFIPLLSADPVFKSFVTHVNLPENFSKESFRLIFSFVVFALSLPLAYAAAPKFSPEETEKKVLSFSFGSEVGVVTVLVALLFATYLILSWPYLFVSVPTELHLSEIGVSTYSEYVRKGFGEFVLAAGLLYGLLCVGLVALRSAGGKSRLLSVAHAVVFAEFILFVFSILRRVLLYQDYHGLSIVRVYGGIFLILVLLLGTTLLARRLWSSVGGIKWVTIEVSLIGVFILFVSFFNVEQFLLLNPPTVNKRVDHVYLSRLSPDGYDGWRLAYQFATQTLSRASDPSVTAIGREERREVAYAGLITSRLLASYYDLLRHYGSTEDKHQFYTELAADYKTQSGVTPSWGADREVELDFLLGANGGGVPSFQGNNYGHGTFYIPRQAQNQGGSLGNLWRFNLSEQRAFERMKSDIPLTNLLQLQKMYFLVFRKIITQPQSERDFEFDISLASPLVAD